VVATKAEIITTIPTSTRLNTGFTQPILVDPPAALESEMISAETFVERLSRLGADRGPRRFPRGQRDREILMKSIVMVLDSGRSYPEVEIDRALVAWNQQGAPAIDTDHVSVRRLLIDHGHLKRTVDGRRYRVGFPRS
jgi:hypothetical protein